MIAGSCCCRGVPRDARSHVRHGDHHRGRRHHDRAVAVIMSPAAEQQDARNVDDQPEHGDRYGFVEPDRNRGNQTRDRLVADQQRNHRQDDGAGESREISKFAGAEAEALVTRMTAGEAVGEGREQQRACMRRHMQAVSDERNRAEQKAPDDLGNHHDRAKHDHHPGTALRLFMPGAQEQMIVRLIGLGHFRSTYLR